MNRRVSPVVDLEQASFSSLEEGGILVGEGVALGRERSDDVAFLIHVGVNDGELEVAEHASPLFIKESGRKEWNRLMPRCLTAKVNERFPTLLTSVCCCLSALSLRVEIGVITTTNKPQ